ncbi:hypothetical protein [Dactylosporangium sp. CA-139066]|uniref:hypothetical protein n=1 Tax=Dactylosporangium sp. CA-139066 TaxID=3239930 RepID=UPI003D8DE8DF
MKHTQDRWPSYRRRSSPYGFAWSRLTDSLQRIPRQIRPARTSDLIRHPDELPLCRQWRPDWRQRSTPHDGSAGHASTLWEILREAGIDPAPQRTCSTWADFLRSQADTLLACDFFETVTLTGTRLYVLAVIEHANRRVRVLGATAHPTATWVTQVARNLVMDLEDAGWRVKDLIRDRDGKFPALFDAVLKDAGVEIVLSGIRMPRMNAIMERWVQTCRRELLDRMLIWSQRHLLHALHEYLCGPHDYADGPVQKSCRRRNARHSGHCDAGRAGQPAVVVSGAESLDVGWRVDRGQIRTIRRG